MIETPKVDSLYDLEDATRSEVDLMLTEVKRVALETKKLTSLDLLRL